MISNLRLQIWLIKSFFFVPRNWFWNSTSVFLNNVRVEQAPSAFVMGVIIAVAICIYYSQPSSQYISSWEGKRRQQIELFLHFAVGRTERRRRSHAVCFDKFWWGSKVYVQKWLELSNSILHRFCLTRGQRSPVRIIAQVQFIYQNQLEPSGGIYHRYNSHWPDFHWNVSKPWLQRVELFENYAIVAMQSDNVTFLSFKMTSGFNLKKTVFSPGGTTIQKTAEIFFKYK
jgi:hypothetical protein